MEARLQSRGASLNAASQRTFVDWLDAVLTT
jgi:hypothetical protein